MLSHCNTGGDFRIRWHAQILIEEKKDEIYWGEEGWQEPKIRSWTPTYIISVLLTIQLDLEHVYSRFELSNMFQF